MKKYIVIGNVAAHDGWVSEVDPDDDSWTYQQLIGAHGTVLDEKETKGEADQVLAQWLTCDSVERGTYCYTHNPTGRYA